MLSVYRKKYYMCSGTAHPSCLKKYWCSDGPDKSISKIKWGAAKKNCSYKGVLQTDFLHSMGPIACIPDNESGRTVWSCWFIAWSRSSDWFISCISTSFCLVSYSVHEYSDVLSIHHQINMWKQTFVVLHQFCVKVIWVCSNILYSRSQSRSRSLSLFNFHVMVHICYLFQQQQQTNWQDSPYHKTAMIQNWKKITIQF